MPDSLKVETSVNYINHIEDSLASIHISVTGGFPPYRYSWSDTDQNIPDRANLYKGSYILHVSDSKGRSSIEEIEILFQQIPRSIVTDSSNVSVVNKNILEPGHDGFIQFKVGSNQESGIIGYTTDTVFNSLPAIGFQLIKSRLFAIVSGRIAGSFGKVKKGDILKILKSGSGFKFFRNAESLHSATGQNVLYRTVHRYPKGSEVIPVLLSSFNKPLSIIPVVRDINCSQNNSGMIRTQIRGGTGPFVSVIYKGSEAGGVVVTRADLNAGLYTIKVTDSDGNSLTQQTEIAYQLNWRAVSGFLTDSNNIRKISGDGWCDSRIYSRTDIRPSETGWISFTIPDTLTKAFIGFNSQDQSSPLYQGLFINKNKLMSLSIDMDGDYIKTMLMDFTSMLKLKIKLSGGQILYYNGNNLLRQEPLLISEPGKLQTSLFYSNTEIIEIKTSYSCTQ